MEYVFRITWENPILFYIIFKMVLNNDLDPFCVNWSETDADDLDLNSFQNDIKLLQLKGCNFIVRDLHFY